MSKDTKYKIRKAIYFTDSQLDLVEYILNKQMHTSIDALTRFEKQQLKPVIYKIRYEIGVRR